MKTGTVLGLSFCFSLAFLYTGCTTITRQDNCAAIIAPAEDDKTFVYWLLGKEAVFKREGCWSRYVALGDRALAIARRLKDDQSVMELSLQLASVWFYLGYAARCLELASDARQMALARDDRRAEIRSLYLISAAERAEKNPEAIQTAEKALVLCDRYIPDDDGLKAKVLYNLAAAESDSKPALLSRAEVHLQEALILSEREGNNYDLFRAGLRLARVQYLRGHYEKAMNTTEAIYAYVDSPRGEMMYHYQLAKIQHRLKKWVEAQKNSEKAFVRAEKLEAKADLERISSLMAAIRHRQYLKD